MLSPESRDELIALVIKRYVSGDSIRTVAQAVQRSYGFVQRALKEAGIAMRTPGATQAASEKPASPTPPPVWGPPATDPVREPAMDLHPSSGGKQAKPGLGKKKKSTVGTWAESALVSKKKKERTAVKDKKAEKAEVKDAEGKSAKAEKCCCKGKKAEKCCKPDKAKKCSKADKGKKDKKKADKKKADKKAKKSKK